MARLILVGPSYPYRGGIAHFQETIYRGLAERGHNVLGITFRRQYPELLFPGRTQYEPGTRSDAPGALRMIDSVNPLSWWETARYIRRQRPDAVLYQHWMPFFGPAYGTIARLSPSETQQVALVHNALPHEQRPGDRLFSRYFFGAVDRFIVMSEAVEDDLASLEVEGSVSRIAHPAYDRFGEAPDKSEARERLGLDPELPVLLFFGFVRKYKGLHVLLEALTRVKQHLPDVQLVVAGEFYDEARPYRTFIDVHGLQENVRLMDRYIPDEEVPLLFSAADVVVQPYVTATQSGVAQVAFHYEKPMILTDVGGLAEVVPHEEAGLVVPPEDPDALGRAIVRFYEEEMESTLSAGVREQRQKYGWNQVYEAIEAAL